MKRRLCIFVAVAFAAAATAAGCGATREYLDGSPGDGWDLDEGADRVDLPDVPVDDQDNDCITDAYEGKEFATDTDTDGKPDYMDEDSDGDTILDSVEGGSRSSCAQPPVDSDGDTVADFRDDDSDGNGIPDRLEGAADPDRDGKGDYADLDNDGDQVKDADEIGGDPRNPLDSDNDSVPDYLDTDSDGDTIKDIHEQRGGADIDTDEDGVDDRLDLDSDGDGYPDELEAGDDDPDTPPVNTDDDAWPDFQDFDSDGDGLSDADELESGTERLIGDSDGDGASDLIEVGYGSDPNEAGDNPRSHGDFVFIVAYNDPVDPPDPPIEPDPPKDSLVFSTNIRQADVFFAVDTTGSMGGEISNLRSSLSTYIIPQTKLAIPDVWFGVGGYDDFPVPPYGTTGDRVFYLEQRMTDVAADAQAAVERLVTHDGLDLPESQIPALKAIADGSGMDRYLAPQDACAAGEVGFPCFRSGSIPIIVLITDAAFHNGPESANPYDRTLLGFTPPVYTEAVDAVNAIHAKVIGVNSGTSSAALHLHRIATDTGTIDISRNPLVFQIAADGSRLGDQVVTAIRTLSQQVAIDISTSPADDPDDFRCVDGGGKPAACCRDGDDEPVPCAGHSSVAVDAVAEFVDKVVPNLAGGVEDPEVPGRFCIGGLEVNDLANPRYFLNVTPGTAVCFDIYVKRNVTVPAAPAPQIFRALINVIGDMITVLDTRDVYFLVPPVIDEPIFG